MMLDEFAAYCWSFIPVTKKTVSNYRGAYNRNVARALGKREMESITRREFLDLLAPLAAPNYFQTLMAVRVIYREALNREIVKDSPVATIKAPRVRPRPQRFLTWEQVEATNFGRHDSHIKFLALHGVTIHSLRKTYAYFLKTNDVHVTTAAKFLGHSDPTITLKIYTLVRDSEIDEVGAKLRNALNK
jgi:integrase